MHAKKFIKKTEGNIMEPKTTTITRHFSVEENKQQRTDANKHTFEDVDYPNDEVREFFHDTKFGIVFYLILCIVRVHADAVTHEQEGKAKTFKYYWYNCVNNSMYQFSREMFVKLDTRRVKISPDVKKFLNANTTIDNPRTLKMFINTVEEKKGHCILYHKLMKLYYTNYGPHVPELTENYKALRKLEIEISDGKKSEHMSNPESTVGPKEVSHSKTISASSVSSDEPIDYLSGIKTTDKPVKFTKSENFNKKDGTKYSKSSRPTSSRTDLVHNQESFKPTVPAFFAFPPQHKKQQEYHPHHKKQQEYHPHHKKQQEYHKSPDAVKKKPFAKKPYEKHDRRDPEAHTNATQAKSHSVPTSARSEKAQKAHVTDTIVECESQDDDWQNEVQNDDEVVQSEDHEEVVENENDEQHPSPTEWADTEIIGDDEPVMDTTNPDSMGVKMNKK